ncbi:3-hydroxyisobutyrate dehydrogenase [Actinosynnema sp. ALI-1.44]|uniref:NAD(P)-dependent oxidoreductase n=1 Tax=Actinosynnema sp. ALI-1.44 TaxID=1933779 RepID=UPI00097C17F9|nr:NAD(P)-dependent oxidoreductase [Actinosynnema sp. ALI-1.44]ONI77891.1 3-hydroxyisobutyrate dehydrogenase [Actinosynnema sp. ALI-1.44]
MTKQRSAAVIGLGAMGAGMARALLAAGFDVTVFNRTAAKAAPLAAAGARVADSAAGAAAEADVVLLSLADENAVAEVLLKDLATTLRPEQPVVDSSTVSPEFSRRAAALLADAGLSRVEACVLGNPEMAARGRLRVFTAGDESTVDSARDVLDALGQQVRHVGAVGAASSLKLAFNLLLGVQTVGLAEAVAFAESSGLTRELVLDVFDASGWRSPVLAFRAEFMRRREYQPAGFRSALMHKDLTLADREAGLHHLDLPLVRLAAQRYAAAILVGHGDDDAAVVVDA